MENIININLNAEQLEILIRGAKRMHRAYKKQYAEAFDAESETKYLDRANTADALLKELEAALTSVKMEDQADEAVCEAVAEELAEENAE